MDIPKTKEREEAARLWQAEQDADAALDAAREAKCQGPIAEKFDKLEGELEERQQTESDALEDRHTKECDALADQKHTELGISALAAKAKAAKKARYDYPEQINTVWEDDKYVPERCAESGVVLFDSDETIADQQTGETWLRAALGRPPRPIEEDKQEEAA